MLGEATHGTHEFYSWRAALTQRLITERGFSFVGVEGDWPDCERIDHSVRMRPGAHEDPRDSLLEFERWPTWMWANEEVVDFTRWLRGHNATVDVPEQVGFHGLDVYSLWASLRELLLYLRENDPEMVPAALAAYRCFEPFTEEPQRSAPATRFAPLSCENEVVDLLVDLRERATHGAEDEFTAWQNAEIVVNAERYYRALVGGGPDAWNLRGRHMDETLARLLEHYEGRIGPGAKAVVWAHNTHVGDARGTEMAWSGEISIGRLARERYGEDRVVLAGFGTHSGTVVAGEAWGAPMAVMPLPEARKGSLEDILHLAAPPQAMFLFPADDRPDLLGHELGHRAVGVVYDPRREHRGNYVTTVLGRRYDAFYWFDESHAVSPLRTHAVDVLEPEAYPAGV
ncbi:erythromycin esterase family protein [Dactylosporangium fulvum]|uniref:Erythromycin esterase family protein n=2 Tax=Dactylosporangium fulvum TaxID=53359 RepID=A0ABY5WDP5_9ACTN|nr:erythromycin esterase family protein [Dactylosporangium fulvum]UWP87481.1 erythromycin esterase family protein [Dactylosporangium fulvum]